MPQAFGEARRFEPRRGERIAEFAHRVFLERQARFQFHQASLERVAAAHPRATERPRPMP